MRTLTHVLLAKRAGLWHLQRVCSGLLLLCMVASKVWDAETKPIEFVCNKGTRRTMNIAAELETALRNCSDSTAFSTPVQLPCTELHAASWENKSHQEKRGDIVASLRILTESVQMAREPSQTGCAASLLLRLENNINNYLLILTHLHLSEPAVSAALSCVPRSTLDLRTLLRSYNQLISGKLERFMVALKDRCP